MTREELKSKWGEITNTDTLIDEIDYYLAHNQWRHNEYGIITALDAFFEAKGDLIRLLSHHKDYKDLRIITTCEFEAEDLGKHVREIVNEIPHKIKTTDLIYSLLDENGKKETEYRTDALKSFDVSEITWTEEDQQRFQEKLEHLRGFIRDGWSFDSVQKNENFLRALDLFSRITQPVITAEQADEINAFLPVRGKKTDLAGDLKTSRAFNRVCDLFGITKSSEYNRLYAQYSDILKGKGRQMKFVVSLHPMDYLTMSNGVSWTSCHSTMTSNRHSHGGYCQGTLSYMLDSTTIMTFVQQPGADTVKDGKTYRNVFHWNGTMLLQSRVYPQGNDGAVDLYTTYRSAMQKVISECLGAENRWVLQRNLDKGNILSLGKHYRDYNYNSGCNYSYLKDSKDVLDTHITIGADGICLVCGGSLSDISSGRITHDYTCSPNNPDDLEW